MTRNHKICNKIQFDRNNKRHYRHTDYYPFYRHFHHQKEDQTVQSSHHDYRQREHQNQSELKELSIEHPLPSDLPLIPPSTRSPPVPPIHTTSDENSYHFTNILRDRVIQSLRENTYAKI